jgi:multisubunit Na+/H+ antiporter MnhF subunit
MLVEFSYRAVDIRNKAASNALPSFMAAVMDVDITTANLRIIIIFFSLGWLRGYCRQTIMMIIVLSSP